jgi:hypothetical protein
MFIGGASNCIDPLLLSVKRRPAACSLHFITSTNTPICPILFRPVTSPHSLFAWLQPLTPHMHALIPSLPVSYDALYLLMFLHLHLLMNSFLHLQLAVESHRDCLAGAGRAGPPMAPHHQDLETQRKVQQHSIAQHLILLLGSIVLYVVVDDTLYQGWV